MKFDFSKSVPTDLQNKLSINKLDLLQKNVLYITYQIDKVLKILQEEATDKGLQKQVDPGVGKPVAEKVVELPP